MVLISTFLDTNVSQSHRGNVFIVTNFLVCGFAPQRLLTAVVKFKPGGRVFSTLYPTWLCLIIVCRIVKLFGYSAWLFVSIIKSYNFTSRLTTSVLLPVRNNQYFLVCRNETFDIITKLCNIQIVWYLNTMKLPARIFLTLYKIYIPEETSILDYSFTHPMGCCFMKVHIHRQLPLATSNTISILDCNINAHSFRK